ncbi:class F sortase [Pseudonocardia phyllosphaerae]|uniref:class F sortase n=1 Tax=Pseudonocardia phyllosphaerae TaxID=3390502 RepID=UPI00397ABEA3
MPVATPGERRSRPVGRDGAPEPVPRQELRRDRGRRRLRWVLPLGVVLAGSVLATAPAGAPEPRRTEPAAPAVAAFTGAPSPEPGLLPAGPLVRARSEPVRVRVARLGLDTAPAPLGLLGDGSLQVPADAGTVGWYAGAPTPGERGPAVLAAHVDWKGRAGAFADLRTMAPGDRIRVDRADGSTVTFAVRRVGQYPKDAFPTAEVYGDLDHAGLRLITCGGAFDRAADSYVDNVVVFADLVA